LLGIEAYLLDQRWELDGLVTRLDPCGETNTLLNELTVSNDQEPLVGVGFNPVVHELSVCELGGESKHNEWNNCVSKSNETG
jgi:hypothetical protein